MMMVVSLNIKHDKIQGKTNLIDVYFTSNPNFEFMLRHFMCSIGLEKIYEKGSVLPSQLIGKTGIARVGVKVDREGKYPDKNNVLDFFISGKEDFDIGGKKNDDLGFFDREADNSNPKNDINDDIPF
jgi:hypothetical protein